MNCREAQKTMDAMFGERSELPESEEVLEHMESCRECSDHFDLLGRLSESHGIPEPEESDLLAMRQAVMRSIRSERSPSPGIFAGFFRSLMASPVFAAGLGLLLLGAGFFGGRAMQERSSVPAAPTTVALGSEEQFINQIHRVAATNRELSDVENSPYVYSNVSVRDEGPSRVGLSFDVARHMEVVLPKDDPLVTEVLLQSLLSESSVGTKLKAVSWAGGQMDPRVRDALVKAMLQDENLGVRLQAQTSLVSQPADAEVEAALLQVLASEESVQMRLVAVDYLTRHNVPADLLRKAVDAGPNEGANALYLKTKGYVGQN